MSYGHGPRHFKTADYWPSRKLLVISVNVRCRSPHALLRYVRYIDIEILPPGDRIGDAHDFSRVNKAQPQRRRLPNVESPDRRRTCEWPQRSPL